MYFLPRLPRKPNIFLALDRVFTVGPANVLLLRLNFKANRFLGGPDFWGPHRPWDGKIDRVLSFIVVTGFKFHPLNNMTCHCKYPSFSLTYHKHEVRSFVVLLAAGPVGPVVDPRPSSALVFDAVSLQYSGVLSYRTKSCGCLRAK